MAEAATFTWDGGGGDNNWSTANNWSPNGAPTQPGTGVDLFQFGGSTRLTPNMQANYNINSLTFISGAGRFVIGNTAGTVLTIQSGGITNNDNDIQTINISAITLGASQTWNAGTTLGASLVFGGATVNLGASHTLTVDGSNSTTISNAISGTGSSGITKNGTGTLTLAGANSYTGATTVSAGVLNIQNATALGTTAGTTSVASGAALQIQGSITVGSEALTLNGTGISTTGALRNISGTNTYGGLVTLGSATRINSDAGSLTLSNAGTITGATFGLTVGGAGNTTINGIIGTTSGTLTKDGAGTLTLTGANTYTGATTVSAGVLRIQNNTALGTTAGGVTVASGAALEMQGGIAVGTEALNTLDGTGVNNGGALRNVSGNNSWAGAITLANVATVRINSDSGTLTIGGTINETGSAGKNLTFGGAGNVTVSGVITGGTDVRLSKDSTGTLTLAGNTNSFAGTTTVNAGTLTLDYTTSNTTKLSDGAALILGGGTVNLTGGSHVEVVGSTTINAGASAITRSANTATLQLNTITRNLGGTVNFGAASIASTDTTNTNGILGAWATVAGTNWAINSTNGANGSITALATYTDVTRLSSGTKAIPNTAAANVRIVEGTGSAANITLAAVTTTINTLNQGSSGGASAATIDASGKTLAVNGILIGSGAGGLTIGTSVNSGTLNSVGTELIINNSSSNVSTINSVIGTAVTGALTKTGTGTVTLTGTNTYTGQTYINQGILSISANNNLGAPVTGAAVNLDGGTLRATASFALNNSGANHRAVTLAENGGAIDVTGANNLAVSGVISGVGDLTKTGTGTLTATGVNTFTGATTVSSGTLTAGAAGALGATSRITVNSGGTLLLAFSGTNANQIINDNASVTLAGGTLNTGGFAGGEGVGALTLSSSSTINLGAVIGNENLVFGNSSSTSWTGTLSVWNWTEGSDHLFFGVDSNGLTQGQLNEISFFSGSGTGFLGTGGFTGNQGEVVPVPEASSLTLTVGLLGLIGWRERRPRKSVGVA